MPIADGLAAANFPASPFAGEDHQGVGCGSIGRQARDLPEGDGEDQHAEKGPNERPEHASTFRFN